MTVTKKLQLGCGSKPMPGALGWINHDITKHSPHVDVAFDLRIFPWPIPEGELYGEILALDVFEHIPIECGIRFFDECWQLLVPGGTLFLRVPEFGSYYHLADLTHVRGFSLHSFDLLDPDSYIGQNNFYSKFYWKILSRTRPFPDQPLNKGRNLEFLLQKRD
ncbi:MAG: hypothetical protein AB7T27_12035 [Kiritimatiellia bacterium]